MQGLNLNYVVRKDSADVELYIDRGKDSEEINKKIFQQLFQNKDKIESEFGDHWNGKCLRAGVPVA